MSLDAFNNSPFDNNGLSIETSSRLVLMPVPKRISTKISIQKRIKLLESGSIAF